MKCTTCGVETTFVLAESADDYQDGFVICPLCSDVIASFVYSIEHIDISELFNETDLTDDELDWRERMM